MYSFRCHIIRKIYYNDVTSFGVYQFTTSTELPYTSAINKDYKDKKKNIVTTKIYRGTINGVMQPLAINVQYDIEAELKQVKKKENYYYNYTVKRITPILEDEKSKLKFLRQCVTKTQYKNIKVVCPDLVDIIVNGQDFPKIKGIGKKSQTKIIKLIQQTYWINELLVWLAPLGVTNKMIEKLAGEEKNFVKLKNDLTTNPYMLTKIRGIGFKKCDEIALKINPSIIDKTYRLEAFINYYLTNHASTEGDTLIPIKKLQEAIDKNVPECKFTLCKN